MGSAPKIHLRLPTSTHNYPFLPTARQNCRRIVPKSHCPMVKKKDNGTMRKWDDGTMGQRKKSHSLIVSMSHGQKKGRCTLITLNSQDDGRYRRQVQIYKFFRYTQKPDTIFRPASYGVGVKRKIKIIVLLFAL